MARRDVERDDRVFVVVEAPPDRKDHLAGRGNRDGCENLARIELGLSGEEPEEGCRRQAQADLRDPAGPFEEEHRRHEGEGG